MIGYKLLRVRADGSLGPLFINARQRIPFGVWLPAEDHPTKGFAHRPGWHVSIAPHAPHLSMTGRAWAVVEVEDYRKLVRPPHQGGVWLIANRMRVLRMHTPTRLTKKATPVDSVA